MRRKNFWMLTVTSILLLLVAWYFIAESESVTSIILPSPKEVLLGLIEITTKGYRLEIDEMDKGFSIMRNKAEDYCKIMMVH